MNIIAYDDVSISILKKGRAFTEFNLRTSVKKNTCGCIIQSCERTFTESCEGCKYINKSKKHKKYLERKD